MPPPRFRPPGCAAVRSPALPRDVQDSVLNYPLMREENGTRLSARRRHPPGAWAGVALAGSLNRGPSLTSHLRAKLTSGLPPPTALPPGSHPAPLASTPNARGSLYGETALGPTILSAAVKRVLTFLF